ncbi:MAG: hypothetical protein WCP65_00650 [Bacteroidota bacterium]
MKKVFFICLAVALAATTVFIGCKKVETKESYLDINKVKTDLSKINDKYKHVNVNSTSRNGHSLNNSNNFNWKRFCGILAADVVGGYEGCEAGILVGGGIGGPHGAVVGGIGGGIIVGCSASYGASKKTISNNGISIESIKNINIDIPNEGNNPFDDVGKRHNEILKQLYVNNIDNSNLDASFLYSNCTLNDPENSFLKNDNNFTNNTTKYFIENTINIENLEASINYIKLNSKDEVTAQIILCYFDGILNLENVDDGVKIAYEYENYFNNEDLLSDSQKQILFEALSIAKYSTRFWESIL